MNLRIQGSYVTLVLYTVRFSNVKSVLCNEIDKKKKQVLSHGPDFPKNIYKPGATHAPIIIIMFLTASDLRNKFISCWTW